MGKFAELLDKILVHANECAKNDEKHKAEYYRELVREARTPTAQAIRQHIVDNNITTEDMIPLIISRNIQRC